MYRSVVSAMAVGISMGAAGTALRADDQAKGAEAVFKTLDADGNGALSEAEYIGKKQGEAANKAKEQFKKLDKDANGSLSLEEFKIGREKKEAK
jgi:Ca2+-binding EF-hand superfamily protein